MADDSVKSLLDREAIRSLMDRYCLALFKADVDLMLSLYWPEAHEEHGDYSGPATGFVAHFAPVLRARVSTIATLSYREINLAPPTEASAIGFGQIVVVTSAATDVKAALVATRYEDVLQKRNGEWRIIRRKADMVAKRAV
jgi:uncharacterized protein (TIGR02246 family)